MSVQIMTHSALPETNDGLGFFRALVVALPVSALFWSGIFWAIRSLIHAFAR
jgi:hypothetical protein